ncbi:hypothetical protein [Segniliparus rugosus]|uniref:Uncharacterized protein n=1 Tax=Segniliparus rugosus (strain ATCC BAA-974 / DSM 45345 / CCUG 50838 / CIP 108380 / JCM 13579 / CDC 945) TaxID=679197 RepID=E5XTV2_SEGRC|nr:hypothetical protein [Segniliparus rugosus]EFV12232.1 hypothetical protein HMPREF9336_02924 [Segniliparus rugosus ATCC BAA-974]
MSGAALTDAEAARRATAVLRDLAGQSRSCPGVAWAVGAYDSGGQKWFYATSNEGMSFLPLGVRWDPQVLLVFDPAAPEAGWLPWRGLANPARIVLDHFLLLRKSLPELRLVSLVSTAPRGEAVDRAAAQFGAVRPSEDADFAPVGPSEPSLARLETVDQALYQQVVSQLPVQRRWPVALALAEDALRLALRHDPEASRSEPELDAGFAALRTGREIAAILERVEAARDEFAARAQAKRVPDQRLDPVDPSAGLGTWADVATVGEPFAYAGPFWRARIATMLAILLRVRADDAYLSKEQVGEIAYEHFCVAEDPEATGGLLRGFFDAGDP